MKKVLVSGASGFIGGWVVDTLLEKGYSVLAFDRNSNSRLASKEGVEVFLGDMTDDTAVTEAMAHVDGWIHLAAVLGTQETIYNPRPAVTSNIVGGLNFLEAAAQYDLPGAYICVGNHFMNNPYSISKTTVERFCYMFNKDRGTRVNLVRAVNAYGPGQSVAAPFGSSKVRKITPSFVCRALTGMPIEIYGDGEQISDMVFVGDVAKCLVHALELANEGTVLDFAIEAGPQSHATVNQVASLVKFLAGNLTNADSEIVHLPMRPGEIAGAVVTADTSTLTRAGVDPDTFTPLRKGMTETVEWFNAVRGYWWNPPSN